MKDQNKIRIPKFFLAGAMGLGIILFLFGIAAGNNPIVTPDLESYNESLRRNPVSVEQLVEWKLQGKRDFRVVGFRSAAECKEQRKLTDEFKCYDAEDLNDASRIRRRFKNLSMPLVVFGNDTAESLSAAARLTHYGYKARILDGGFAEFESRYLQSDFIDMDIYELDEDQMQQLSVYRYLTGSDPLLKIPGQSWAVAMADASGDMVEEEVEGYEEGGDDDEEEFVEDEPEEEYEGC